MRGKRFLDVFHADPPRSILALPEQAVDEDLRRAEQSGSEFEAKLARKFHERTGKETHLQEVSDVSVGSFGVGPWDFNQGTLLTNYKNVHDLSNVVAVARSKDQEVSLWHLVQVDWSAEKVVFKRLRDKRHTICGFASDIITYKWRWKV